MRFRGKTIGVLIGIILVANMIVINSITMSSLIYVYVTFSALVYGLIGWWIGSIYDNRTKTRNTNIKEIELLKEKEKLYHSLFTNNIDGILILDLHGNVIDGNPAIEKQIGYSTNELKEMELASLVCREDLDRKFQHCHKAVLGEPQVYDLSITNKSGDKLSVIIKMIPIMNENNIVVGIFEIIKDVTEAKKLEILMHQSDKLSAIGELAAGVAHEIRNPLTTLKGFLQILQPEINSSYTKIMEDEIERINLIVSEFLVLSKPQEVLYKSNSIITIIKKVIFLLEPQANMNNIQVQTKFDQQVPNINCEENQLKQVLINLIKNAMESMPNGGNIYIEVTSIDNKLCVLIQDEGHGIPQEQLHKIGEPFYTTKEDGTGLGLLVTHRIIEKHGGLINIESEVNKGTLIKILLPF